MISPMFLGAAAILLISLATSAMAQQVISEPGYCAQFYPNANCQNKGPNNPYTGDYQHRSLRSKIICVERCLRAGRWILPGP